MFCGNIDASFPKADHEISGKSMFDAIQDTEAFVAANDDMIVVVFRGTSELTDWATNLKFTTRNVSAAWGLDEEEDSDVHEVGVLDCAHWSAFFVSR